MTILILYNALHRDVRGHQTDSIYIYVNDLIVAVEAAKAGRHGRGRSGVGIDVCR